MEAALKAIAAPRRRQILTLVRSDELSAGEIAAHFDVTRPAVSQHLRVLKDAHLLVERREGTRRLYRARPEGLAELRRSSRTSGTTGWIGSSERPRWRSGGARMAVESTGVVARE